MTECQKYEELVSLYIDNMLDDSDLMDLLEHLDTCNECNELYRDLKALAPKFREENIEYPEDLHDRIWDYINENKASDIVQYKQKPKYFSYIALAACVLFGVFISSDSFINMSLNFSKYVTQDNNMARTMDGPNAISQDGEIDIMPASEPVIIDESRDIFNIEYNQYAFVFEFVGSSELTENIGEILYSDKTSSYIKVSNSIPTLEKTLQILEDSNYVELEKSSTFSVNADSDFGIYVLYKTN